MAEINFEDLGKTISSAAENVGKKTEAFLEMQKIRAQIHSAQRSVEKSYKDLGELIYQRYDAGEGVDCEVAVICEDISQLMMSIVELKSELAAKRGRKICPVCQAEVEEASVYCMKCGSKMEDAAADDDDIDEDIFEDEVTEENAEEAAEEINEEETKEEEESEEV